MAENDVSLQSPRTMNPTTLAVSMMRIGRCNLGSGLSRRARNAAAFMLLAGVLALAQQGRKSASYQSGCEK
jgi:hypothetical protein